jgi:hypothetical protein
MSCYSIDVETESHLQKTLLRTLMLLPISIRSVALGLVMLPLVVRAEDPANKLCPMMPKEAVEAGQHTVELGGVKIGLCCGQCEKLWRKSDTAAKYYAKVALELGVLPQLKGKEKELGLDKITLMEQRYCPVNPDLLVCPENPTVEFRGKKIYVHSDKAKATWEKQAEVIFTMAMEAGVLPQFAPAKAKPEAPASTSPSSTTPGPAAVAPSETAKPSK